jgi:hypothetical protein
LCGYRHSPIRWSKFVSSAIPLLHISYSSQCFSAAWNVMQFDLSACVGKPLLRCVERVAFLHSPSGI